MAIDSTQHKRPVRSYVIRSGRLTDSQRKAIDEHWHKHVFAFEGKPIDIDSLFVQKAPINLEIGFGMGASLLAMAQQQPEQNFLGIEVHKPGVGKMLHEIEANGLSNVKLICHDAKDIVEFCIAKESLDRILILFPDPWPKNRHHKRRLIQADFAELLVTKLRQGGFIHLATDWEPYAKHMMVVLQACPNLKNKNGSNEFWNNPERPPTKFEVRGKTLGNNVSDLLFVKED